jgi:hypothetical protein
MSADVPPMTWFANIMMLLWRFVDKMDGECGIGTADLVSENSNPFDPWRHFRDR